MVSIGGNDFSGCLAPIICGDRAIIVQPGWNKDVVSVVRLVDGQPVFEVLRNRPVDSAETTVTVTTPGIITATDAKTGRFLYKVRPGSETSVVFGSVGTETDTGTMELRMRDKDVVIWRVDEQGERIMVATFIGCGFEGGAGIVIDEHGAVSGGAPLPPQFRLLFPPS